MQILHPYLKRNGNVLQHSKSKEDKEKEKEKANKRKNNSFFGNKISENVYKNF